MIVKKISVNSKSLLSKLNSIVALKNETVELATSGARLYITVEGIDQDEKDFIVCESRLDFACKIYQDNLKKLIKILDILEEQPITLIFKDGKMFNIKVTEMYI